MVALKHKVFNDDGNINLDFLVGLLVFMMAFLYVIVTIPGVFLPYQANSVDLVSVAYRTSAILAEDPGWWTNKTDPVAMPPYNNTNWESSDHLQYVARVGLANDKQHPNLLSLKKISMLKSLSYDEVRTNLSLGDISDMSKNTVVYNFTLGINMTNSAGAQYNVLKIPADNDVVSELIGYERAVASIIESIDRIVMIDEGGLVDMGDCGNPVPGYDVNVQLNVNGINISTEGFRDTTNITIRITNYSGDITLFNFSFFNNSNFISYALEQYDRTAEECFIDNELTIHIRNNTAEYWISNINADYWPEPGNIIDIILNGTKICNDWYNNYEGLDPGYNDDKFYYLQIDTQEPGNTPVYFPDLPYVDYSASDPGNVYYKHSFSNGIMTLQVWQA